MSSKLCDSCKSAKATLFCRADLAFLCVNCDTKIHATNKLASRHARVWVCEVCEHAPAYVTCKADAAALCVTCDRDIHSANPLAHRHERVPITPFYDSVNPSAVKHRNDDGAVNFLNEDRYFDGGVGEVSREEAEAASWLLPNPKVSDLNTGLLSGMDPCLDLDLDYGPVDTNNSLGTDGVVPVQRKNLNLNLNGDGRHLVNDACLDLNFSGSKSLAYEYNPSHAQSLSQSVSCSSPLDVGVVPDGGSAMKDITNPYGKGMGVEAGNQMVSADREARVWRYREKKKNRKFEKTIRYASRKAYAEMRPRIKGRFVKRTDLEVEAADPPNRIYGYGVVPSF